MKRSLLLAAATLMAGGGAVAQTILPNVTPEEQRASRPPRAHGIPLALAVEAAQTAVSTCAANGNKVTAVIIDSAGVPVAMLSGDGAAEITQRIGMAKAYLSVKTGMDSADVMTRVKTDPALKAELDADPRLGVPRPGGIPIRIANDLVGAMAVSGSPSGAADIACTAAGLAKIADRLK